jgi:acetoin utilization protein AcuB
MYIKEWMSTDVVTVTPEDPVTVAVKLMREKDVRHLPVVDKGALVGILSDRVIKDYLPSEATTLDIFELHYLLGQVKVGKIMRAPVFSAPPDTPVEEAALLLHDHQISCLPVVEAGKVIGIITDKDMYEALIQITGVKQDGHRICLLLEDKAGSIREAGDIIRSHGFGLESILSSHAAVAPGKRMVVIRTRGKGDFPALRQSLLERYPDADIRAGNT